MVKVLLFRFQQCFGPITMLLIKESSETRLFKHLSNHVFRSPYVPKYMSSQGHLFLWKCSKLNVNLANAKKKFEAIFCFWDNSIWKCCYKLSLLRREYLLSAVNGLRFCISLRETLSTWVAFTGINKYGKGAVIQLWTVSRPVYDVTCRRALWNGTFSTFI